MYMGFSVLMHTFPKCIIATVRAQLLIRCLHVEHAVASSSCGELDSPGQGVFYFCSISNGREHKATSEPFGGDWCLSLSPRIRILHPSSKMVVICMKVHAFSCGNVFYKPCINASAMTQLLRYWTCTWLARWFFARDDLKRCAFISGKLKQTI